MALTPDNVSILPQPVQNLVWGAWSKVTGLFQHRDFMPELSLANTPGIDPHFIPRAAMSNANLDVGLLAKLGNIGLKRGREITAETHPELYGAWQQMCGRAGIDRIPQLILAESASLNAMSVSGENAVVMTTALLKKLNLREVRAVLGHELGHEASDHTKPRLAALAAFGGGGAVVGDHIAYNGGIGAYMKLDEMKPGRWKNAMHYLFDNGKKPLSMLGYAWYIFLGASAGSVVAAQVSVRPTELDADRKGAMISGDPEALVSALTKLEESRTKNPLIRWYRKIESGYPSTETRKERLREMAHKMPLPPSEAPAPAMGAPLLAAPRMQVSAVTDAARVAAQPSELVVDR